MSCTAWQSLNSVSYHKRKIVLLLILTWYSYIYIVIGENRVYYIHKMACHFVTCMDTHGDHGDSSTHGDMLRSRVKQHEATTYIDIRNYLHRFN